MRTHENITEICLTREINLIFNKTKLNILYISNMRDYMFYTMSIKISEKKKQE